MLISAQDRLTSAQYAVIVQSNLSGQSPGALVTVVEVPGGMPLSDQPWSSQSSWQNLQQEGEELLHLPYAERRLEALLTDHALTAPWTLYR